MDMQAHPSPSAILLGLMPLAVLALFPMLMVVFLALGHGAMLASAEAPLSGAPAWAVAAAAPAPLPAPTPAPVV